MRGGHDHAAAGEVAAHQIGEPVLRRHVERRGRLVQAARAAAARRPAARSTAAAVARPTDRRPAGWRAARGRPPAAPSRSADRRRRDSAPRIAGFRRPSATASPRPGGRRNAPARRSRHRARRRRVPARRRPDGTSPAITRSSEDLPAPLRPVTTRASPPDRLKLRPRKDLAPAPAARQIIALELHQARFSLPTAGGKAMPAAENPDIPRIFAEVPSLIWRPAQKDLISPPLRRYLSGIRAQVSPARKILSC